MASSFIDLITNIKGKVTSSFKKSKDSVKDLKEDINDVNKEGIKPKVDKKSIVDINKLKESFGDLKEEGIAGVKDSIPSLNNGFVQMVSKIHPAVAAVAAIGAAAITTAMHFSDVAAEYGKLRDKYLGVTNDIVDATEAAAKSKAISDIFQIDEKELFKAARTVSKEFGIPVSQALDKIKTSLIATNGELGDNLDWLNEYSAKFKESGASAEDFFVTIDKGFQEAGFSNKALDFFKEAGNKIAEMSDSTKTALIEAGIDVVSYQKKIESGELSRYDATKQIYEQITLQTDAQKKQNAMVALGAATLEDGSLRALDAIVKYEGTQEDLLKNATDYQKKLKNQVSLQEQINSREQQFSNSFKGFNEYFANIWAQIKLSFYDFLVKMQPFIDNIIKWFKGLWDFLAPIFKILGKLWWIAAKIGAVLSPVMWMLAGVNKLMGLLGEGLTWLGEMIDKYVIPIIDWLDKKITQLITSLGEFLGVVDEVKEVKVERVGAQDQRTQGGTAPTVLTPEQIAANLAQMEADKDKGKQTKDSLSASNTAARAVSETRSIVFNIGNLVRIDEQNIEQVQDLEQFRLFLTRVVTESINNSQQG